MNRTVASVSHHPSDCACWRCREGRGEDVYAPEFRSRAVDPTDCAHPDDDKDPVSGDGWLCGHCGDLVPKPGHLWPARFTEAQKGRARYLVRPQPAPTASADAAPTWPTVVCVTDGVVFLNYVDNQAALRDMLVADMIARDEYGRTKYEKPLTRDNGRDNLIDWYQEKLDGLAYAMNELQDGDKTGIAKRLFRQDLLAAFELRAAIAIRDREKM